jgi:hypothetical protein
LRKKLISVSWWINFNPFTLEPKSSAQFLEELNINHAQGSSRAACVNKCGSDEEQLLQMSDHHQHCPVLAVRDLHQN